jgi:hypothetical protein
MAGETLTNAQHCDRHNFDYVQDHCPCCVAEGMRPIVSQHAVSAPAQQIEVRLPLTPGSIIDEQVRQVTYQGIRADVQALINKWGFRDYNVQLKWPDTDNHPTIEFFSAQFAFYQRFLGSMIDKCGTLSPSMKLRFIQALVRALDRLGYYQELQTIMTSYEFSREQNRGIRQEENPDDPDNDPDE